MSDDIDWDVEFHHGGAGAAPAPRRSGRIWVLAAVFYATLGVASLWGIRHLPSEMTEPTPPSLPPACTATTTVTTSPDVATVTVTQTVTSGTGPGPSTTN